MNTLHPTTKLVNEDQPMTLFGEKTPRAVIYKSESHKLHQAFSVKKDKVIHQGMPVALDTEGNIEPYIPDGAGSQVYLGIAVTDNINPAYQAQRDFPVEVTVAVEAFMVVNWVAKEVMGCGYVKPTNTLLIDRFITAESSVDEETKFISIVPADEVNDIIQVLVR